MKNWLRAQPDPPATIDHLQALLDRFQDEYNHRRPHRSLPHHATPATAYTARPKAAPSTDRTADTHDRVRHDKIDDTGAVSLRLNGRLHHIGMGRTHARTPSSCSSTLALRRQQFWLGPARAGIAVTLWADTAVVHLLVDGVRLKTVPSRLTAADLVQLLAEGGKPAGPPPVSTGPVLPGGPVEVERLVNGCGLVALAGRHHPVGIQFAGQRVTVRIDHGVLQLAADGVLLRSLPNPLAPAEVTRIRDARPAGPSPVPAAEPIRVRRRVSSRGALVVAGQRVHVGIGHAGRILDVEPADRTIRIYDEAGVLVAEVPCTTTKGIARFKVRRPEPRRSRLPPGSRP